jgi:hypothetical protein
VCKLSRILVESASSGCAGSEVGFQSIVDPPARRAWRVIFTVWARVIRGSSVAAEAPLLEVRRRVRQFGWTSQVKPFKPVLIAEK